MRISTWTNRQWRARESRRRTRDAGFGRETKVASGLRVIVLGVDPGTATTGYGVVRGGEPGGPTLIECGVIRTSPRATLARRIMEIFDGITDVIDRHAPEAMAVESVFFAKNARTTLVLGHARGVVLLAGERAGLAVHEYAPKLVKKTVVGTGAATKSQVQAMVARLLRLKRPPEPADAADGVACALTCVLGARFQARVAALRGPGPRAFPAILKPDLSRIRAAGGLRR